jgi:Mu-like prophage I protein
MRLNNTSVYSSIMLDEVVAQVPKELQILRVGKFNHPQYGAFEITTATLAEMKANFDNKIRGIDMAFDYFHDSDKDASAWVNSLELRESGTELWATVSWTPKATQKLAERELRYFSPDFAFKWEDPETGTSFNNVLFGGGLTNRPFVKEMQAIVADEKQRGNTMTELEKAQAKIKELEAKTVKLSEQNADMEKKLALPPPAALPADKEEGDEVAALKKTIADLQAQLAKAQGDSQAALAEKAKADEAVKMAEKNAAFNTMLSEGKACVAQKDAYLKGDMNEFIKLAQPLNMKGSGVSDNQDKTETEKFSKIIKLAEDKQKANPKMAYAEAVSMAKKEIEKQ